MKLIENIERFLKINNLSRTDLAKLLEVSPSSVTRWMDGSLEPDLDSVHSLLFLMGIAFEELVDGDPDFEKRRIVKPVGINVLFLHARSADALFDFCKVIFPIVMSTKGKIELTPYTTQKETWLKEEHHEESIEIEEIELEGTKLTLVSYDDVNIEFPDPCIVPNDVRNNSRFRFDIYLFSVYSSGYYLDFYLNWEM